MASSVATEEHRNGSGGLQRNAAAATARVAQVKTRLAADSRPVARVVRGLGVFSLGLGAAQAIAPGALNRLIGVRDERETRRWQRIVAAQELSAGAGIMALSRPLPMLWGRTAADVMHIGLLVRAYQSRRESTSRLAVSIASLVGCLAADAFASVRMSADRTIEQERGEIERRASTTIQAPPEELAARWRQLESDGGEDARLGPIEVLAEDAASGITWRTTAQAKQQASGVTRFTDAPGSRGTEVHVTVRFQTPGGELGAAAKKVAGVEPLQLVRDDLHRLKQLVETGQIARSEGAPSGSSATLQPKQRPAQPLPH